SFARIPVMSATEACHVPNPSGAKIGATSFPTEARKLASISLMPAALKFARNQSRTDMEKMMVPAFFRKDLPLSQVLFHTYFMEGSLYSGSSMMNGSSSFLKMVFLKRRPMLKDMRIPKR